MRWMCRGWVLVISQRGVLQQGRANAKRSMAGEDADRIIYVLLAAARVRAGRQTRERSSLEICDSSLRVFDARVASVGRVRKRGDERRERRD